MALLAHLALATSRGGVRRDRLVALFWPELDQSHARAALNQALYALRSGLGDALFVSRRDDHVALDPNAIWCDALIFEEALAAGRAEEALDLYRGDLLDGFFISEAPEFERWVDDERRRLRQRASDGAWMLAEARAAARDGSEAVRWATRAVDLAPVEETVVRRLMLFLRDLGDRAAAIRAYEAFAWRLRHEYELEPSAETQALASLIRREDARPPEQAIEAAPLARPPDSPALPRRRWPGIVGATVVGLGVLTVVVSSLRESQAPRGSMHLPLDLAGVPRLASGIGGSTLALSPDASRLVYVAEGEHGLQLYLRAMDRLAATPVPNTRGATHPFFSPDGQWLGFVSNGAIRKIRLSGGEPIVICEVTTNIPGATWSPDGEIIFATPAGLWRVPAAGGKPRALALSDTAGAVLYRWPHALPTGRAALLTVVSDAGFELAVVSLESGRVRLLGIAGTSPRFVEPGYLTYALRGGTLHAVRFDPATQRVTGSPMRVTDGVRVGIAGEAKLAVSNAGALVYVPVSLVSGLSLVDRAGRAERVPLPPQEVGPPRFSPDGVEIVTTLSPGGEWPDVWVLDLRSGAARRVTFDSGSVGPVVWSGSTERIIFASKPGGRRFGFELRWVASDGSAPVQLLLPAAYNQIPLDVTPDHRALLVQRHDPERRGDIWILPLEGERLPRPYRLTAANERGAAISPNGRRIAWMSDESGRDEVYVGGFPEAGVPVQVSFGGGREPRWAPDGRELYYRGAGGFIAVRVDDGPTLRIGPREVLFDDAPYVTLRDGAAYDVHPDGRRFVMMRRDETMGDVLLLLDWLERLRGRPQLAR